MNYYEHHIGDYLRDTAHLSLLEHGVYRRLMDVYYTREAPLPAAQAARLAGARTDEERAAVQTVLDEFFMLDEAAGMYRHARCDREIEAFKDKQRKASASAASRWKRQKPDAQVVQPDSGPDASAMRTHSERIANEVRTVCIPKHQTPDTINIKRAHVEHQEGASAEPPPDGPRGPARAAVDGIEAQAETAVAAMRQAGLQDASASHPQLLSMLRQGMTVRELVEAAADAATRGKGFPWALARAKGRREDAVAVAALPAPPPGGAADPQSRAAIEAEGVRLGLGRWEQIDAQGKTVLWREYAARVKKARENEVSGEHA